MDWIFLPARVVGKPQSPLADETAAVLTVFAQSSPETVGRTPARTLSLPARCVC